MGGAEIGGLRRLLPCGGRRVYGGLQANFRPHFAARPRTGRLCFGARPRFANRTSGGSHFELFSRWQSQAKLLSDSLGSDWVQRRRRLQFLLDRRRCVILELLADREKFI